MTENNESKTPMGTPADPVAELTARQRGELEAIRRGWLTPADTDRDENQDTSAAEGSPRAKALAWLKRNGKPVRWTSGPAV